MKAFTMLAKLQALGVTTSSTSLPGRENQAPGTLDSLYKGLEAYRGSAIEQEKRLRKKAAEKREANKSLCIRIK